LTFDWLQVMRDQNVRSMMRDCNPPIAPCGGTFVGDAVTKRLNYFRLKLQSQQFLFSASFKPLSIAVITDGEASDPKVLTTAIKNFAQFIDTDAPKFGRSKCPRDYIGMQFVQIGDDESAAEYLASLDDDLFPGQPDKDFVDTVTWSPQWNSSSRDDMVIVLLKALCGGSNIDIDTAASNRGAKPKGSGAQRSSAGGAAGTFGQYPAVEAIKKSLAPFLGDFDSQRIMLGAVVMFVALIWMCS